jgi:phospholipase/carboxylesterase
MRWISAGLLGLLALYTTMTYSADILHTDLSLKYLSHTPSDTKNKPLIIFIHGYGSNEKDMFSMKSEFMPEYSYVSVQAPLSLFPGGYQWFSLQMPNGGLIQIEKELNNSRKLLEDFIKAIAVKYQTMTEKILLIGFSQGAIMSYEIALKNPKAIRGMAALSGAILPTLQLQITAGYDLKNLAIFIGHGTNDNRVPYSAATIANETLSKTTIKPEFHTYQGLGHSINQAELADLKKWIVKTLSTPR